MLFAFTVTYCALYRSIFDGITKSTHSHPKLYHHTELSVSE